MMSSYRQHGLRSCTKCLKTEQRGSRTEDRDNDKEDGGNGVGACHLDRLMRRLVLGDSRLDDLECLQVCRSFSAVVDGYGGCDALSWQCYRNHGTKVFKAEGDVAGGYFSIAWHWEALCWYSVVVVPK